MCAQYIARIFAAQSLRIVLLHFVVFDEPHIAFIGDRHCNTPKIAIRLMIIIRSMRLHSGVECIGNDVTGGQAEMSQWRWNTASVDAINEFCVRAE